MTIIKGGRKNAMKKQMDLFQYFDEMGYIVPAIDEYLAYLDYINKKNSGKNVKKNKNINMDEDVISDEEDEIMNDIYVSSQWDQTKEHTFYLTKNVFDSKIVTRTRTLHTMKFVDLVLDIINNVQKNYDQRLPYFIIVHSADNHRSNGKFQYQLDAFYAKLVEFLDFDKTLLHLTADHGNLIGSFPSTQYGNWETKNPNSLMFFPKYLVENELIFNGKYKNNIFTINNLNNLYINQQRFITHYDIHFFWKYLIYKFINPKRNVIRDNVWKLINDSLVSNSGNDDDEMKYENIIENIISKDRNCKNGIYNNKADKSHTYLFCFCDMPTHIPMSLINNGKYNHDKDIYNDNDTQLQPLTKKPLAPQKQTNNATEAKDYYTQSQVLLNQTIERINYLTGNGEFDCKILDVNDFTVIEYLESEMLTYLLIEQGIQYGNVQKYNQLKKENRVLQYSVTFKQSRMWDNKIKSHVYRYDIPLAMRDDVRVPLIERTSYFKYEKCITNDYDLTPWKDKKTGEFADYLAKTNIHHPPVMFKNEQFTKQLMRKVGKLSLRLCSCKRQWSLE